MKTISDYTIYCTSYLTTKALKLGAPIEKKEIQLCDNTKHFFWYDGFYYNYPTAEQMIGYLLENGITDIVISRKMNPYTFGFNVWYGMHGLIQEEIQYPTRKEATLAAIDAALEYLIINKK